ncbi:MAG: hypothetical protein M1836_006337 [Candelina mexicana]|nr:MAG: hypothetical protein M1836_006337 [Candelina mexicana]
MDVQLKDEETMAEGLGEVPETAARPAKSKSRNRNKDSTVPVKRRCVSTACIACRRRKSKVRDLILRGASQEVGKLLQCIYDPNSDHRRKGVYKKDIDNLKTRNSTLQTLIQAILNYPEEEVPDLVREIRTCESLDDVAESIITRENGSDEEGDGDPSLPYRNGVSPDVPTFETELSGKMGELRLDNGSVRFIGGTSNLIFLGADSEGGNASPSDREIYQQQEKPIVSWTCVIIEPTVILHLMEMYFTWHYSYFTTLSKSLFYRDFLLGQPPQDAHRKTEYCTPLLVNAMLALGCHFTSLPAALADPNDPATAGDHFFKEAKRLLLVNDEHETPKLTTVQALALMSVREAGCGREAKGWVYSGMSFRMACDLGLNLDSGGLLASKESNLDEQEIDARRITFWGCFVFDKCWSNYLGRVPQLSSSNSTVPKFDVFPAEESDIWSPYTDAGTVQANSQPARTRAVFLQLSLLCEISSDLLIFFYHPTALDKPVGKQAELKKLGELHTRLEAWRKNLPKEMEPKEGQLPNVLVMHMFFQLLFIHLFRPFLKYNQTTSPLPAHVSPRKICTHAAAMISKLLRLYKRTYGLRQIVNVAVYIAHTACTIHLLNLPEKNAKRDIIHGIKHLDEIAEGWLVARRTLGILAVLVRRWKIELPEEAATMLIRAEARFGAFEASGGHSTSPPLQKRNSVIPTIPQNLSPPPSMPSAQSASAASFNIQSNRPFNSTSAGTNPEKYNHTNNIGMTLPPKSAAELQAIYVKQHQKFNARIASPPNSLPNPHNTQPQRAMSDPQTIPQAPQAGTPSPTYDFGNIEGLVGESQDWWTRDQAAFELGLDNWGTLDPADAGMLGNVMSNGLSENSGVSPTGGAGWP